MTSSLVYPLFKLTSFPTGSLYYFSLPSVLTCSTGPHMENRLFFFWEVFFFLKTETKSTPHPDAVWLCLPVQFVFKWIAEKTWWPFDQHIYQRPPPPPLLLRLLYFPAGPSFPFCLSLSSSFCFSDWLFEPSMGPGGIVRHAFFLPKFCLCVLQSHWGLPSPFPVYSSFVASRKAFILHLFSSTPPLHCNHPSFSPLPPFWKRQEVNADVGPTWAHFSFSCSLCHDLFLARSFFFSSRPPRLEKLLHHTLNTLTYWTSQWRLSITIAACLFVVSLFCHAV